LLVSEKAALGAQLEHLRGEEARMHPPSHHNILTNSHSSGREESDELLREERERRAFIGTKLQAAEKKVVELTAQLEHSQFLLSENTRRLQEQV
jgi:hypothetical protein